MKENEKGLFHIFKTRKSEIEYYIGKGYIENLDLSLLETSGDKESILFYIYENENSDKERIKFFY